MGALRPGKRPRRRYEADCRPCSVPGTSAECPMTLDPAECRAKSGIPCMQRSNQSCNDLWTSRKGQSTCCSLCQRNVWLMLLLPVAALTSQPESRQHGGHGCVLLWLPDVNGFHLTNSLSSRFYTNIVSQTRPKWVCFRNGAWYSEVMQRLKPEHEICKASCASAACIACPQMQVAE